MATMRRTTINRNKVVKIEVAVFLGVILAIGMFFGMMIQKRLTPVKIETEIQTVLVREEQVEEYQEGELPTGTTLETYYDVPLSHSLQNYIYEVCSDQDVPMSLAIAMIDKESEFNPEAISESNDYGLMQINSINTEWFAEEYSSYDLLNPYQNVFCGIVTIGNYLKTYNGDYEKALMAYNMGEYGAKKLWDEGVTSSKYSRAVIELMTKYEQEVTDSANE